MKYKCLNKKQFVDKEFSLNSLEVVHSEPIRLWRNAQKRILRQEKTISRQDQDKYFKTVILPLYKEDHPHQILFSYFKSNHFIGYGGLTYINWSFRRAEVSFLLDSVYPEGEKTHSKMFSMFLKMLKKICIEELDFHRLLTETYDIRPEYITTLESHGFRLEGRMVDHVKIDDQFYDSLIHGLILENK